MAKVGDVNRIEVKEEEEAEARPSKLLFRVQENPPIPTLLLFAVQQVLVCISGIISMPMVIADTICAKYVPLARVALIGTMLFIAGISTILQGASFSFFPVIVAFMQVPEYRCVDVDQYMLPVFENGSRNPGYNESRGRAVIAELGDSEWTGRMEMVPSPLPVLGVWRGSGLRSKGASWPPPASRCSSDSPASSVGIGGVITRYVGPMTIAPLMILLEISIVDVCFNYISSHWFSIVIVCLLVLTALYLNSLSVPFPTFSRKRGCTVKPLPLFAMFPYLFAIGISWVICVILTATDALPPGSKARTDLRISVLSAAPWFQWPYPGQFGPASFNAGLFLGFVAGTVASVIESVGDYYACARVCGERAPPSHAVNRGIAVEGVGCMVSGMLGGGVGVTTYSENIGVIGITGVASRRTMQAAGAFMILLGVLTKIGALFATIPDPIIGGILTLSLAMVGGVGLSSVQLIDLKLSRNVAILGFSIMSGLLIPKIVRAHPPNTGSQTADDSLKILLTIDMFIGGVMGFFLDNTVPGATREERGLRGKGEGKVGVEAGDAYAFPPRVSALLARLPTRYLPFLPNPASG